MRQRVHMGQNMYTCAIAKSLPDLARSLLFMTHNGDSFMRDAQTWNDGSSTHIIRALSIVALRQSVPCSPAHISSSPQCMPRRGEDVNRVWTTAAPAQCGPSQRLNKHTQSTAAASANRVGVLPPCAFAVAKLRQWQLRQWYSCGSGQTVWSSPDTIASTHCIPIVHKPLCRG
jgi:hypothetical protein